MPSGITAGIYEGDDSVRNFLMRCGRQFAFAVDQRDEAIDAPVRPVDREGTTRDQHLHDWLADAQQRVELYAQMTVAEATRAARLSYQRQMKVWREEEDRKNALRDRYVRVRAQVEAWEVPEELEALRKFALDQLDDAIEHDTKPRVMPAPQSGVEYLQMQRELAARDVEYWSKSLAENEEREDERDRYTRLFLNALPKE